jgi:hypothetical protein
MFNEEQKIKTFAQTVGFALFMLLLSSFFDKDIVMILLLCLIYTKMRD